MPEKIARRLVLYSEPPNSFGSRNRCCASYQMLIVCESSFATAATYRPSGLKATLRTARAPSGSFSVKHCVKSSEFQTHTCGAVLRPPSIVAFWPDTIQSLSTGLLAKQRTSSVCPRK